jgi:hypothetical protein
VRELLAYRREEMNIAELKAAAEAATPGLWRSYKYIVEFPKPEEGGFSLSNCPRPEANAEFIALANPATILKLIAVVELAQNLNAVKGRHHTEQAFVRLTEALKELES